MSWNRARLLATLDELRTFGDDNTLIECKRAEKGMPKKLGETLCAFANMPNGGTVLLGVDEHAGFRVTGIQDPAQMQKAVVSHCRKTVNPAPQLEFTEIVVAGSVVLAVEVASLLPSFKPATYNGKPYLRQADGDYRMNANDIRLLQISGLLESERKSFDMERYEAIGREQLDGELVASLLATARSASNRFGRVSDDEQLLQLMNVIDSSGNVRRGGLYALGYFPQTTEPSLSATAAVRLARTDSRARTSNLEHFDGPLPNLIDDVMEWIRKNTDSVQRYTAAGHMENHSEFPMTAIREFVANAFVHRDLGPSVDSGKKIEIRVTDTHLIIQSPGGLHGLSIDQLTSKELAKSAVNQHLYGLARYLETRDGQRLIEGEGGGIREALVAMQEAELRPPEFIDTGTQFKVLLRRGSRFNAEELDWLRENSAGLGGESYLKSPQKDLLVGLRRLESYSRARLCKEYEPLARSDVNKQIDALISAGLIEEIDHQLLLSGTAAAPLVHSEPRLDESVELRTSLREVLREDLASHASVDATQLAELGKNVPTVYAALNGDVGYSVKQLQLETNLSANQIRYALAPLLEQGLVTMEGGQGTRSTTYRQA